jgi:diaminopimelate decarboxylase
MSPESPPYHLSPLIDPPTQSLLAENFLLEQLVSSLGSPLNIVLPQRVAGNVAGFRAVYSTHRLGGRVYYAHKANRSSALARQVAATDAGIDVASLAELQHALGAGFDPERIMATGPKNREFLWLAARAGVVVNADSVTELTQLAQIVATHSLPRVRVLARLSGFDSTGVRVTSRRSRFGVLAADVAEVIDLVEKHPAELELLGVAFHLDTIGITEKAVALEGCLAALEECRRRGQRPWSIDIGGGFGVNYLADGAEWDRWTSSLTQAVLGRREPLAWNGYGYGLRAENGVVRGALGVYPAHRPIAGPAYLDKLLQTPAPAQRRQLGSLLLDTMYDLVVEPGRALLDQCGLVLARVLEVRDDIVRLDCNARDVSLEEHGVLMDPVVLSGAPQGPFDAWLFGNLCLEADLITRRKVSLTRRPVPGDLLAFVNTAGYFMDFSATQALRQPVARTIAMWQSRGAWKWCLDEQYWPVLDEQVEVAA